MKSEVVVTGMGVYTSIGNHIDNFEKALRQGKCGIRYEDSNPLLPETLKLQAKITYVFSEEVKKREAVVPDICATAKKNLRRASKVVQLSALASMEAWVQAGLYETQVPKDKLSIIVAGSNLNQSACFAQAQKYMKEPEYVSPSYALQFMDTDLVGNLSELFGIQEDGFTIGGASASGNVAIIKAYQFLMRSDLDACMVVAPIAELSKVELMSFHNLNVLGGKTLGENSCRPFDKKHEGFVPAEGCGCIILEKKESALRRNATIYAQLLSGAISLDGNRLSNPSLEGESNTMKKALEIADIDGKEIGYINAHATSTPMGDEIEVAAIKKVFDKNLKHIWVNSTKSLTGHCLYSAGLIELIATILEMRGGFVHPNLNLEEPIDTELNLVGNMAREVQFDYAMSNSFGFGGINTCVIIKRGK